MGKNDKSYENNGHYDSFNLAKHVNDRANTVTQNRQQLVQELDLLRQPWWLEQIHSTKVVEQRGSNYHDQIVHADGSYTSECNRVCVVMTADCLPILFCDRSATWVAATHAGWRGLVDGIIEQTISSYKDDSSNLIAWLGPAISQKYFEVGAEVREMFTDKNSDFIDDFESSGEGKFKCDLYSIARKILATYSIETYGGDRCTFAERNSFYSYRRDGETGRMASLIWIEK